MRWCARYNFFAAKERINRKVVLCAGGRKLEGGAIGRLVFLWHRLFMMIDSG